MHPLRTLIRSWRSVAIACVFAVIVSLGIFAASFTSAVAHAAGPQLTVDSTGIRTTTPLIISEHQVIVVTNVASATVTIASDGAGSIIENGTTTLVTSSEMSLGAGKTMTLQFTQPGVYHLMSANTTGGTETITVIA